MKIAKCNYKFPRLTKEEFEYFKEHDKDFFKNYNLSRNLQERIASSLHWLAVKKLLGLGFEKNKEEAIRHHLKACQYDPCLACQRQNFRRETGLLIYKPCEK